MLTPTTSPRSLLKSTHTTHYLSTNTSLPRTLSQEEHTTTPPRAPGACSCSQPSAVSADDVEFLQFQKGLSSDAADGAAPTDLVSSCVVHGDDDDERC